MSIPEGYRLLTAEDVGKVFGVDLESVVYCDTSVIPISAATIDVVSLANFVQQTNEMGEVEVCYIAKNGVFDGYQTSMYEFGTWKNESIEMNNNISVTSYNTDVEWNNWLYVKDKADPYSITIKNKEGIKLLTKDKDIHFDDDVKITIDESLLGGGETKKYSFTLYHDSDPGGNIDQYYSVDGGAFADVPFAENSVSLAGNTLVIFSKYYRTTDVYVTGGSFVGIKYNTSSTRYYVVVVTITEDNAEVHFSTYD